MRFISCFSIFFLLLASTSVRAQDDFDWYSDSDYDGVPDYMDMCPGIDDSYYYSSGYCEPYYDEYMTLVEIDSDGDGVPDHSDMCPGADDTYYYSTGFCDSSYLETLYMEPEIDSDGDGVSDSFDMCPGEDDAFYAEYGMCESDYYMYYFDSDGDGVPDYEDVCPGEDDFSQIDGVCPSMYVEPVEMGCWEDTELSMCVFEPSPEFAYCEEPRQEIEKYEEQAKMLKGLKDSLGTSLAKVEKDIERVKRAIAAKLRVLGKSTPKPSWYASLDELVKAGYAAADAGGALGSDIHAEIFADRLHLPQYAIGDMEREAAWRAINDLHDVGVGLFIGLIKQPLDEDGYYSYVIDNPQCYNAITYDNLAKLWGKYDALVSALERFEKAKEDLQGPQRRVGETTKERLLRDNYYKLVPRILEDLETHSSYLANKVGLQAKIAVVDHALKVIEEIISFLESETPECI